MKIIGHRGARGLAPENTIAGLKKALEYHVDEVEFDLRVTKDQIVVLHHDRFVTGSNGSKYGITNYLYQELKHHKPDLTTFSEALGCINNKVRPYIEVKPNEPVELIIKVLHEHIGSMYAAEDLLLASKSQKTLRQLHAALPAVPKIVIEPWSGLRAIHRAHQVDTKFISMNQLWLWRGFITAMSRRGWKLYAYTLNNPVKVKRWANYGLYAIVTDYPDRFKS